MFIIVKQEKPLNIAPHRNAIICVFRSMHMLNWDLPVAFAIILIFVIAFTMITTQIAMPSKTLDLFLPKLLPSS
ncbi:uncharacterized protein DS421_14g451620 [Arachis hypogaea]|nr:uncharacterized protein DS421_14g451620 [Arachis hypogaea]